MVVIPVERQRPVAGGQGRLNRCGACVGVRDGDGIAIPGREDDRCVLGGGLSRRSGDDWGRVDPDAGSDGDAHGRACAERPTREPAGGEDAARADGVDRSRACAETIDVELVGEGAEVRVAADKTDGGARATVQLGDGHDGTGTGGHAGAAVDGDGIGAGGEVDRPQDFVGDHPSRATAPELEEGAIHPPPMLGG